MSILLATGRELAAAVRSAATMAFRERGDDRFHGLNPKQITESDSQRPPTILLHGDMHNATAWYRLSDILRKRTVGPLWAVEYSNVEDGVQRLAAQVATIQDRYAQWGVSGKCVRIVGHSLGGLVATDFLRRSQERICKVITVGSRLKPTGLFKFAYASELNALEQVDQWLQSQTQALPLHNIAAEHDWLVPLEATLAPCAQSQLIVPATSHLSLLYARITTQHITALLS